MMCLLHKCCSWYRKSFFLPYTACVFHEGINKVYLKGGVGKFEKPARDTLFCYIPWNALNIPIAMNILSALTKNP